MAFANVPGQCTVDWRDVHQRIDGFGGGVVFLDAGLDPLTSANMDTLYGTNPGQLGLSLLRVRISPTTNWTTALQDAQQAVSRGAGVLATPWTPPAVLKDNNSLINGGSLLPTNYAAYASYLRSFATFMASNGAPLRAISIQNEPEIPATYESCLWNSSQFLAFFRTNLGAFTNLNIVMPESVDFNQSISDPTLNDPSAVTNVSIVAGHLYGATIADYPNAHNQGKPTWMTEFLVNDQSINTAVATAKQIHDCLTVANMSAYIWWKCIGDANGLLDASGVAQYRGYVMGQFSRFVRPGYNRIGVTSDITPVSAYQDTRSGSFAIVAINTNAAQSVDETFVLRNFSPGSVTPWVTSASQLLASQAAVAVNNGEFTFTLPPQSVVTFVGQVGLGTPPPPPYGTNLAALSGGNPNGPWSLFMQDDKPINSGYVSNGWILSLTLADVVGTAGDLQVLINPSNASALVGQSVALSVSVTNYGPSISTNVTVLNTLPAGAVLVSSGATQGTVSEQGATLVWNVGALAANTGAGLSLIVQSTVGGSLVDSASVQAGTPDPNPDDDSAQATINAAVANVTLVPTLVGGHSLQIGVPGPIGAGVTVIIQANSNLISTNWLNIYTGTPPFNFTDPDASNYVRRFYRAQILP
jgi:glucuronoarabinoxylan endo-1,4-beta-xylanase